MCGHTLCSVCIQKIVAQNFHVFKCPFDKKACEVQGKDPETFPKNFELLRLIEQKNMSKSLALGSPRGSLKTVAKCPAHEKKLELICVNDKCRCCMVCAVKDHKGHDIVLDKEFDDEIKKKEASLQRFLDDVAKIEQQYITIVENSASVEKIVTINSIEEQFRNLIQNIVELKDKIIAIVNKEITSEKDRIKQDILSNFTSAYSNLNLSEVSKRVKELLKAKTSQNGFKIGCEILELEKTIPEAHLWIFNNPRYNKNIPTLCLDEVYRRLREISQRFIPRDPKNDSESQTKVIVQHLYSCVEIPFEGDPIIGDILMKIKEKLELKSLPYFLHFNGMELQLDKKFSDYKITNGSYLKIY